MQTCTHALRLIDGHPYLELDGESWLYDTGSPTSFGRARRVRVAGSEHELPESLLGVDADMLGGFVGRRIAGLLGCDILGRHDWILDVAAGTARAGEGLDLRGLSSPLDAFMGLPVALVQVGGTPVRMIFDTGAQLSYWQDEALDSYPPAGVHDDFFPGMGSFQVRAHHVPLELAGVSMAARCARLPGLLALALGLAGVQGVLGSEVLVGRQVGWFPARSLLVLGPAR